MGEFSTQSGLKNRTQGLRLILIFFAIGGLTLSLATRTFRLTFPQRLSVVSGAGHAMRQHLDRDALGWAPPKPLLSKILQVPTFYPYVAPGGPPLAAVLFDESLYNRPPPTC